MLKLAVADTHLYPGCRATLEQLDDEARHSSDEPVSLVFSDGAMAAGTLADAVLSVEPYTTAAGTAIAAKAWVVARAGTDLRVTGRRSPA